MAQDGANAFAQNQRPDRRNEPMRLLSEDFPMGLPGGPITVVDAPAVAAGPALPPTAGPASPGR